MLIWLVHILLYGSDFVADQAHCLVVLAYLHEYPLLRLN